MYDEMFEKEMAGHTYSQGLMKFRMDGRTEERAVSDSKCVPTRLSLCYLQIYRITKHDARSCFPYLDLNEDCRWKGEYLYL
jgi:hypothetical protein